MLVYFFYFMGIVIRAGFYRTAFGNSFCAFHHQSAAGGAKVAGRLGLGDIFAFRIVGTAVEKAKAAAALGHQTGFTQRASHAGAVLPFELGIFLDIFAFRII